MKQRSVKVEPPGKQNADGIFQKESKRPRTDQEVERSNDHRKEELVDGTDNPESLFQIVNPGSDLRRSFSRPSRFVEVTSEGQVVLQTKETERDNEADHRQSKPGLGQGHQVCHEKNPEKGL